MSGSGSPVGDGGASLTWEGVRDALRARGLRWTPQRRILIDVLVQTRGHVTGTELIDRCRQRDPTTIPSTVYRTLDVLEDLGLVRHHHGHDGREEFHVLPEIEHGHLYCRHCGASEEIRPDAGAAIIAAVQRDRGFEVELSHVTMVGRCAACREERPPARRRSNRMA